MNSTSGASTSSSSSNGSGTRNSTRAGLREALKSDGRRRMESGKQAAAEQMEDLADALDVAGSHLDASQPTLARYATRMADGVAGVAKRLRDGRVEDLTREARALADRNPGMFLLGGAALGVVVARFLRASAQGAASSDSPEQRAGRTASAAADSGGADTLSDQDDFDGIDSVAQSPRDSSGTDGQGLQDEASSDRGGL